MPSPFDALDAQLSASVLDAYGESAARIVPRVSAPYGAPAPDPARQEIDVTGVFSAGPAHLDPLAGAPRDASGLRSTALRFWVPASWWALHGPSLRRGDALVLLDRSNTPVLAIASIAPTDLGDAELVLTREDSEGIA